MTPTHAPTWRAARNADVAAIARMAHRVHPALPERIEVLADKLALCPDGCRVLARNGAVVGYGLSHPWRLRSIPPLDTRLTALPAEPDCLLIHDVVILPEARGEGAAGRFVEIVETVARARKITALALVSVYDTQPLWTRLGFEVVADPALASTLKSYGERATYMVRSLGRTSPVRGAGHDGDHSRRR